MVEGLSYKVVSLCNLYERERERAVNIGLRLLGLGEGGHDLRKKGH